MTFLDFKNVLLFLCPLESLFFKSHKTSTTQPSKAFQASAFFCCDSKVCSVDTVSFLESSLTFTHAMLDLLHVFLMCYVTTKTHRGAIKSRRLKSILASSIWHWLLFIKFFAVFFGFVFPLTCYLEIRECTAHMHEKLKFSYHS